MCPEGPLMAELWHDKLKCPTVIAYHDASGCETEADWEERTLFYERELREEVIPVIEQVCGRPYDYDRLSEILTTYKKIAEIRREILELMKNKPSPMTIFDLSSMNGAAVAWTTRPDLVQFYEGLLAEVKERVAQGIGAVTGEKYRFYWDSYTMWSLLGIASRAIVPHGGNILIGRYPIVGFFPNPDWIWPERPLYSVIYGGLRHRAAHCLPKNYIPFVANLIEQYSCDAMLVPTSPTCHQFNMGQEDMVDEMERKFGIPALIFESDMVDLAFFSRAQFETRLEALIEMIDARRRRR